MKDSLFARAMVASSPNIGVSPQQREKDRAVEVAREIVDGHVVGLANEDLVVLARQLLRALALPA